MDLILIVTIKDLEETTDMMMIRQEVATVLNECFAVDVIVEMDE